jgi:2,5-diketo-D-gluconate reductase A
MECKGGAIGSSASGQAAVVGTVQATLHGEPGCTTAEIAWVVAMPYQGQGYATESAAAMSDWLLRHGVDVLVAHVHPEHRASIGVARRLGMAPTSVMVDGELVGPGDATAPCTDKSPTLSRRGGGHVRHDHVVLHNDRRGKPMQKVTLNNGVGMPILGFGVFQIPPEQTEQAVSDALEVGYRHIDTAASYGNEEAVGRAIARSGIRRNELFVTTKMWVQDAGEDNAKRLFEESRKRLGLDHVDLYLIHQPFGDYYGSWRAMQDLHREGLIRAIGLANFYPDRLVDLIEHNEITPAVNQIETHPFFQRHAEQELMHSRGVQIESWGPFAEGRNDLFTNPTLSEIGAAHGKSVAQVVLRWLIQREVVVIPKSVRRDRMAENFDVFDFELTAEHTDRIAGLDTGASAFFDHRDPEIVSRIGGRRS